MSAMTVATAADVLIEQRLRAVGTKTAEKSGQDADTTDCGGSAMSDTEASTSSEAHRNEEQNRRKRTAAAGGKASASSTQAPPPAAVPAPKAKAQSGGKKGNRRANVSGLRAALRSKGSMVLSEVANLQQADGPIAASPAWLATKSAQHPHPKAAEPLRADGHVRASHVGHLAGMACAPPSTFCKADESHSPCPPGLVADTRPQYHISAAKVAAPAASEVPAPVLGLRRPAGSAHSAASGSLRASCMTSIPGGDVAPPPGLEDQALPAQYHDTDYTGFQALDLEYLYRTAFESGRRFARAEHSTEGMYAPQTLHAAANEEWPVASLFDPELPLKKRVPSFLTEDAAPTLLGRF